MAQKSVKTKGSIKIQTPKQCAEQIKQLKKDAETAVQRTVSDMRTRAPGKIASSVAKMYNISASEINPNTTRTNKDGTKIKQLGTLGIRGETLETLEFVYEGRPLTMSRFQTSSITPTLSTSEHTIPGAGIIHGSGGPTKYAIVRSPKPYKIKIKVKKGHTEELSGKYNTPPFMAPVKKGSHKLIPFQRTPGGKFVMDAIKTTSIPQMIDEEKTVRPAIQNELSELLGKRLDYHMSKIK